MSPWYALECLWQGDETVVQTGLSHQQLSPPWQMFLLGDGSPTRHLQLLTGQNIVVDLIDMVPVGSDPQGSPPQLLSLPAPWTRRQVWLQTAAGECLAYAASWWEAQRVDSYLPDRHLPIWASLATLRTELYRDIQGIYYGHQPQLGEKFGAPGPFWGRHYLFWHQGQPLTLIYEVFSPHLQAYLGPQ